MNHQRALGQVIVVTPGEVVTSEVHGSGLGVVGVVFRQDVSNTTRYRVAGDGEVGQIGE